MRLSRNGTNASSYPMQVQILPRSPTNTNQLKQTMKQFDITKPYQARNGKEAEILCKDMGGTQPYGGRVRNAYGTWILVQWSLNGCFYPDNTECDLDLVNV
jgi:hypothetical protein